MASSTSSALISAVPKLNESNFIDWKFAVSTVLRRAGCLGHAVGTVPKPDTDPADWDRLSDDALAIITLTVEPSQYEVIRDALTAHDAWKALHGKHQNNTRANRIGLKRQLYNFRHNPEQPISVYIDGFKALARRLRAIGVKIEEVDLMDLIIIGLDPSWDHLAAILSRTITDLDGLQDVTDALIEEETRRGGADEASSPDVALIVTCWNCGKTGHKSNKCRAKKTQRSDSQANLAMEKEGFSVVW